MDLIPFVDARRTNAIHLTAIARIVEFLGYQQAPIPTPLIRTNAARATALLWDGQTLVLGPGLITNVIHFKNKVPGLGDLPLIGRLFRSEGTNTVVKHRIVLITPTLIDPAGNRINDPENPPFPAGSLPSE